MSLTPDALMVSTGKNRTSIAGEYISGSVLLFFFFSFPLIYQFISPFVVPRLFPELAILERTSTLITCTESAEQFGVLPSDRLPLCGETDKTTISCLYAGEGHYEAPSAPTREQTIVCPTLTSQTHSLSGQPMPSSPVEPMGETEHRIMVSFGITLGIMTLIGLYNYIRGRIILGR